MQRLLLPLLLLLPVVTWAASLRVSNTLGSNMVLQRGRPAPIWGWATPSASVSVTFDGAVVSAKAGADGLWHVALPAQPATLAPKTITIKSSAEQVQLTNVLFGDVILCSGQSNMEFVLSEAENASAEVAAADGYPHIRVFKGAQQQADSLKVPPVPLNETGLDELLYIRMNWSVASSKTVGRGSDHCCGQEIWDAGFGTSGVGTSGFSAICWLAARDYSDMLGGKVPIGTIDQSYGGTSIQFWMSESAIKASNAPVATQCCRQDGGPSCLYNGQIHPYTLGPMQFSSVLWYQGEQNANCGGPTQTANGVYSTMLQTLVEDWRAKLQQPTLPFGTCTLAPWKHPQDNTSFAQMRLAQVNLTPRVDNCFDISTLDSGDPAGGHVHSKFKQAPAHRAALGMASFSSIQPTLPYKPPAYASATASISGSVTVTLSGLYGAPPQLNMSVKCPEAFGAGQCAGFEVLSSDCVWHKAGAALVPGSNALLVTPESSGWTGEAVGTRYGYANWPLALVKNVAGIPLNVWYQPLAGKTDVCKSSYPP